MIWEIFTLLCCQVEIIFHWNRTDYLCSFSVCENCVIKIIFVLYSCRPAVQHLICDQVWYGPGEGLVDVRFLVFLRSSRLKLRQYVNRPRHLPSTLAYFHVMNFMSHFMLHNFCNWIGAVKWRKNKLSTAMSCTSNFFQLPAITLCSTGWRKSGSTFLGHNVNCRGKFFFFQAYTAVSA
jgi:hypothetical protein